MPDLAYGHPGQPGHQRHRRRQDPRLVAEPADHQTWEFRSSRGSSWRIDADRRHRINGVIGLRVDCQA
jgi:hypothetical protein